MRRFIATLTAFLACLAIQPTASWSNDASTLYVAETVTSIVTVKLDATTNNVIITSTSRGMDGRVVRVSRTGHLTGQAGSLRIKLVHASCAVVRNGKFLEFNCPSGQMLFQETSESTVANMIEHLPKP